MARVPRVACPACGVKQVEVPWARPNSAFTLLMETYLLTLCQTMPVKAVTRLVGEHDPRLWRVLHHDVGEARSRADFSEVRRVGMDETSARRGHHHISLFLALAERFPGAHLTFDEFHVMKEPPPDGPRLPDHALRLESVPAALPATEFRRGRGAARRSRDAPPV